MIANVNDFTTNGFLTALSKSTDIIQDGLTANDMFVSAGINFVQGRQVGSNEIISHDKKAYQYYGMQFDVWYPLAKYALNNIGNKDATIAKFAQQLAVRIMPIYSLKLDSISQLVNATSTRFSDTLIPTYNFVPNMSSIFSSSLFGRNFDLAQDYTLEAKVSSDFAGADLILGIYDQSFTLVGSITATVNSDGFAYFKVTGLKLAAGTYFIGLKQFQIFDRRVYSALNSNLISNNFISFGGLVEVTFNGLVG